MILLAALALVLAGMGWLEYADPGVGPVEQPLSAHGLGSHALLWSATVALAGAIMLSIARRWRVQGRARAGPVALALAGVAFILVAIFTTDPWYPWQHAPTWSGWIHVIATGAGMCGLSLAMLCTFARDERANTMERIVAGGYTALLAGVLLTTLARVVLALPVYYIGLEERVLLLLAAGWLAIRTVALAGTAA